VRELVLPKMERHGPIEAWIIDDTGFPKKGQHSVGAICLFHKSDGRGHRWLPLVHLRRGEPVIHAWFLAKHWRHRPFPLVWHPSVPENGKRLCGLDLNSISVAYYD
jgi:hypothetical protein